MSSYELDEKVLDIVLDVEEQLQSNPAAALELAEQASPESAAHPEVRLARARALTVARGLNVGRTALEDLVREEPEFAEARHALALLLAQLGDHAACVRELLEVLRLDAAADAIDGFDLSKIEERVVASAEQALNVLPGPLRRRLVGVPIVVQERPEEALVRSGFDPRSLGVLEGPPRGARGLGVPAPARIVLYAANLATFVDPNDEEDLVREICVMLVDEVSQYFELGEAEVENLRFA